MRPHRRQPTRLRRPWDSPGKNTGVGCHFFLLCMKVKSEKEVTQSCLTLSDPMDCSLPGSFVHGISQARVLEWGAVAFSDSVAKIMQLTNVDERALSDRPYQWEGGLWYFGWTEIAILSHVFHCWKRIITAPRRRVDGMYRKAWEMSWGQASLASWGW